MPPVRVVVAGPEDASAPRAELWVGGELMAVAFRYDGRLHLRIEPRPDGEPWLIEADGLALALDNAAREIVVY
jgi:hypothetical protein